MLFDTHAHYDSRQFDADRDAVLSALPGQGVELVVNPGCDLESSRKAVALAEQYPFIYAAVGVHPEDCGGWQDSHVDELRRLGYEKIELMCLPAFRESVNPEEAGWYCVLAQKQEASI